MLDRVYKLYLSSIFTPTNETPSPPLSFLEVGEGRCVVHAGTLDLNRLLPQLSYVSVGWETSVRGSLPKDEDDPTDPDPTSPF